MEKLTRIRAAMQKEGFEAVLLTNEINCRYATGYAYTDGLALVTAKSAHLITDSRYTEEATMYADPAFAVVAPESRLAYITGILTDEGIREIGYENLSLSCAEFDRMREQYHFAFRPMNTLMNSLRICKDEDELAAIAEAQDLTDRAFTHILSMMTPAMTEIDVALELEFFMRKNGADGVAFDTIAVSGSASSLPHGKCRPLPLQKGFLTMDFGARVRGYCADMTRTVCIGRADAEIRRVYDTVLAAQSAGLAMICAGESCVNVDKAARDLINGAGYEGCFGHGLGHGVGLEIHEEPRLSPRAGTVKLEVGQVVTVEPGVYLEGKYGCRIEDLVTVTADGYRNFTRSSKEFIELFA